MYANVDTSLNCFMSSSGDCLKFMVGRCSYHHGSIRTAKHEIVIPALLMLRDTSITGMHNSNLIT